MGETPRTPTQKAFKIKYYSRAVCPSKRYLFGFDSQPCGHALNICILLSRKKNESKILWPPGPVWVDFSVLLGPPGAVRLPRPSVGRWWPSWGAARSCEVSGVGEYGLAATRLPNGNPFHLWDLGSKQTPSPACCCSTSLPWRYHPRCLKKLSENGTCNPTRRKVCMFVVGN